MPLREWEEIQALPRSAVIGLKPRQFRGDGCSQAPGIHATDRNVCPSRAGPPSLDGHVPNLEASTRSQPANQPSQIEHLSIYWQSQMSWAEAHRR